MSQVIEEMLKHYNPQSKVEYENAIQEIMQEITLAGLWRAKFFEHAAFYGGTSLRILYGLNRFSEDLDFSLLKKDPDFNLEPFLNAISEELELSGLKVLLDHKIKKEKSSIRSAFLKTGTLETFIRIGLNESLKKHTQSNEVIKMKLEVDIDPPEGFETEVRYLMKPFPFSIKSYVPRDLFAGKMHAILCRPYKVRVKGRDWYDLIWYIKNGFELNLSHLEMRMRQSKHYQENVQLSPGIFKSILEAKIAQLDIKAAKEDIKRFIPSPRELDGWSNDFFLTLIPQISYYSP
ncbi:MAG: hypothetical protein SP1CHLAM54_00500 [Chlamydiia bacterium]|nr:hypothetical protein [Chlamydiia bacterium]MCH9614972.1 hypothetical protein [Chlamydiia bacterium]MCH9629978.1 hypothetical protein [Chlamydiia bacterium]